MDEILKIECTEDGVLDAVSFCTQLAAKRHLRSHPYLAHLILVFAMIFD